MSTTKEARVADNMGRTVGFRFSQEHVVTESFIEIFKSKTFACRIYAYINGNYNNMLDCRNQIELKRLWDYSDHLFGIEKLLLRPLDMLDSLTGCPGIDVHVTMEREQTEDLLSKIQGWIDELEELEYSVGYD